MNKKLGKTELQQLITGATIMASGGGGSFRMSAKMLDAYVKDSDSVEMVSVDSSPAPAASETAALVAGIGSPEGLLQMSDPESFALVPYNATKVLESSFLQPDRKTLDYVFPIEVGACNGLFPFIAAILNNRDLQTSPSDGMKVFDMDGAGRSVPTLPLTVYSIHRSSYPMYPGIIAQANEFAANPSDPDFAIMCSSDENDIEQTIIAAISSTGNFHSPYKGIAGLLLYSTDALSIHKNPGITGTLNDAICIGKIFEEGHDVTQNIISYFNDKKVGSRFCKRVFSGTIESYTEKTSGLDLGTITIKGKNDQTFVLNFENENIYGSLNGEVEILSPDSICYIPTNGPVFDNSDLISLLKEHEKPEVDVIAIEAPEPILNSSVLMGYWKKIWNNNNYSGPFVQPWKHVA